ncbi:hypothetical protein [Microbacterium panaciterrae]|uniref:Uncharacterized protein n=1 Tax=Microbacterium panaciterrae TaxID=985759 RepID=A0ABP8PN26_9MICO
MNLLAALAGGIVAAGIVLLITYFRPAPLNVLPTEVVGSVA